MNEEKDAIVRMDGEEASSAGTEAERKALEKLFRSMVSNIGQLKQQAESRGLSFSKTVFDIPEKEAAAPPRPRLFRVGRSTTLLTTESLPDVVPSSIQGENVTGANEKKELSQKQRRRAVKNRKKKRMISQQKRNFIPKV